MEWFKDKRVFLTGGSAGIGRAAAVQMAGAGAHVYIAARGQAQLDASLAEMRSVASTQQRTGAVSLDVTDRPAVREAARDVIDGLGGLDVLVCNTGYAHCGWAHEAPDSDYDQLMTTNYMGQVNVVRALLPHFLSQGSGDICLVSTLIALVPTFGYTAYSGSKTALVGFADCLRQEVGMRGVRVTMFHPPATQTPGLERENRDKPAAVWEAESGTGWNKVYTAEEVATGLLKAIPRGRFENVHGLDSRLFAFAFRHFPRFARWVWDGDVRKAAKRVADKERSPQLGAS
jgi:NAD(P)-dependent dehydrogenase (short-subunit alcohol dehydrogenase family)